MHPLDPQNERLAQELTERLARNFNIRFSAAEQYEMALLLVSRTSMLDYAAITPDNIADYIGSDCTDLVHQLINTVKDFYDINLDEPEFSSALRYIPTICWCARRTGASARIRWSVRYARAAR